VLITWIGLAYLAGLGDFPSFPYVSMFPLTLPPTIKEKGIFYEQKLGAQPTKSYFLSQSVSKLFLSKTP
jgi:hypothetical protein